jgi:hypothetical protein
LAKHNRCRHKLPPLPWPVDIWVPEIGWVSSACMTPAWLATSIQHVDLYGDLHHPVSRWQGGREGAVSVGLGALVDFPPGPRDSLSGVFPIIVELVADGLVDPTHTFRNGQRVFCISALGRETLGTWEACGSPVDDD